MRVDKNSGEKRRKIFLTGIGMGMPEMLTARAKEVIDQADCLIGAKRMLECAKRILPGEMQEKKKMMVEYRPEQIAEIIKSGKGGLENRDSSFRGYWIFQWSKKAGKGTGRFCR